MLQIYWHTYETEIQLFNVNHVQTELLNYKNNDKMISVYNCCLFDSLNHIINFLYYLNNISNLKFHWSVLCFDIDKKTTKKENKFWILLTEYQCKLQQHWFWCLWCLFFCRVIQWEFSQIWLCMINVCIKTEFFLDIKINI